jgi:hypothetical protein
MSELLDLVLLYRRFDDDDPLFTDSQPQQGLCRRYRKGSHRGDQSDQGSRPWQAWSFPAFHD